MLLLQAPFQPNPFTFIFMNMGQSHTLMSFVYLQADPSHSSLLFVFIIQKKTYVGFLVFLYNFNLSIFIFIFTPKDGILRSHSMHGRGLEAFTQKPCIRVRLSNPNLVPYKTFPGNQGTNKPLLSCHASWATIRTRDYITVYAATTWTTLWEITYISNHTYKLMMPSNFRKTT